MNTHKYQRFTSIQDADIDDDVFHKMILLMDDNIREKVDYKSSPKWSNLDFLNEYLKEDPYFQYIIHYWFGEFGYHF